MKKITPLITLIISNSVPLFGVLFFNWNLFSIIFLYWLESGVIGFYNVIKLFKVIPKDQTVKGRQTTFSGRTIIKPIKIRIFYIPFFIAHYGGFFAGHGVFVFALFGPATIPLREVIIAAAFMLISHGISYVQNFLNKEEYHGVTANQQMFKPYARVFVMHITILGGAALIDRFHEPVAALFLLIFLKTLIDLASHLKEHGFYKKFIPFKVLPDASDIKVVKF